MIHICIHTYIRMYICIFIHFVGNHNIELLPSLCVYYMNLLFLYSALSVNGTRVLNANSPYPPRSTFIASGVRWKYRRNSARERLSASGTLTQAAVVEVFVSKNGSNVRFTYKYTVDSRTTQMPTAHLTCGRSSPNC